jgi:hypothetical protein
MQLTILTNDSLANQLDSCVERLSPAVVYSCYSRAFSVVVGSYWMSDTQTDSSDDVSLSLSFNGYATGQTANEVFEEQKRMNEPFSGARREHWVSVLRSQCCQSLQWTPSAVIAASHYSR